VGGGDAGASYLAFHFCFRHIISFETTLYLLSQKPNNLVLGVSCNQLDLGHVQPIGRLG
jgi:hypothetical protein